MDIQLKELTIRDLVEGYSDDGEGGVTGFGGKLDIRPPYQREFVYKAKQRDAVIDTVIKGFPLNVMYWAARDDDTYEIIDGQQRTISVAQYVVGDFSHQELYFHNLPSDRKAQFLDYELMVYVCSGADSEKLDWFETVNIAGVKLTNQELRNAVYAGSWLSDAKRYFSRNGCAAYQIGQHYVQGAVNRQEYLETAIHWASRGNITDYMATHQHELKAEPLWDHFQSVIEWVESRFTKRRPKFTKGVEWGQLYDEYKNAPYDPEAIEREVARLVADDDVQRKSGIYPYVLTRDEKHLNIRAFSPSMKQKVYEKQDGICPICKESFDIRGMEADHITPWSEGGKTVEENCQMLCKKDNRRKAAQ